MLPPCHTVAFFNKLVGPKLVLTDKLFSFHHISTTFPLQNEITESCFGEALCVHICNIGFDLLSKYSAEREEVDFNVIWHCCWFVRVSKHCACLC